MTKRIKTKRESREILAEFLEKEEKQGILLLREIGKRNKNGVDVKKITKLNLSKRELDTIINDLLKEHPEIKESIDRVFGNTRTDTMMVS